jgi:hypothetical protein
MFNRPHHKESTGSLTSFKSFKAAGMPERVGIILVDHDTGTKKTPAGTIKK